MCARPVILATGLGAVAAEWDAVARPLTRHRLVVRFDRPGLDGLPGREPPTLRGEAERIAAIAAGLAPVVVVAHSVAAFHAEALARTHPALVAGVVLVDPSHPGRPRPPRQVRLAEPLARLGWAAGAAAGRTGLTAALAPAVRRALLRRQSLRIRHGGADPLPPREVREVYGSGPAVGAALAEYAVFSVMARDLCELRRRHPFPPVPLTVLSALGDVPARAVPRWRARHAALAALSPRGRVVELARCGHLVHVDDPDAIVAAVAAMRR